MLWKQLIDAIKFKDQERALKILEQITSQELNKVDQDGWSALHHSAFMGNDKVIGLLLKIKPELASLVTNKGFTSLHWAAWKGHENIIKILLEAKPEIIDLKNNKGQSAMQLAKQNKKEKIVKLLENYQAKIKQSNEEQIKIENTVSTVKEILDIISKAIADNGDYLHVSQHNVFIKHYDAIKNRLPQKIIQDNLETNLERLPQHGEPRYFIELDKLISFREAIWHSSSEKLNTIILKVLQVFEDYANDIALKKLMQEYAQIFEQQIDILKTLGVTNILAKTEAYIIQSTKKYLKIIEEALREGINNINLIKVDDAKYYEKAIFYLNQSKTPNYLKNKALALDHLGRIEEQNGNWAESLLNYVAALELDRNLTYTYEKIGNLLFKHNNFKEAISCYKAINHTIKVIACYRELLKINPDDLDLTMEKADYLLSIGYDNITKSYHEIFSKSNDLNLKAKAWEKISLRLYKKGEKEKAEEFKNKAFKKDFINYLNLDQIEEFSKTISSTPEAKNIEPDESLAFDSESKLVKLIEEKDKYIKKLEKASEKSNELIALEMQNSAKLFAFIKILEEKTKTQEQRTQQLEDEFKQAKILIGKQQLIIKSIEHSLPTYLFNQNINQDNVVISSSSISTADEWVVILLANQNTGDL